MDKPLIKIYGKIIFILSFFILAFFVWLSLISTSTVTLTENVFFTEISGTRQLILFLILLIVSFIPPVNGCLKTAGDKLEKNDKLFKGLYYGLLAVLLLMSVIWVFATRFISWADSVEVQKAAAGLVSGDYSAFTAGGYIGRWHNQIGLVLIEAAVIKVFGSNSGIVFQLVNAICVPVIAAGLSEFVSLRIHKIVTVLVSTLYLPILFSISHVYGNIPGLMLSLLAFVFLFDAFEKKSVKLGILSALLMGLACLVKQNYIIFLIAYIIICILTAIKNKKMISLLAALIAVVTGILLSVISTGITEHILGFKVEGGVSKWSYIAMAMQEGYRAPGWCNDYNMDTYDLVGHDEALQSEMAKKEVHALAANFAAHPKYAVDFYVRKLASQWNEPTFQTIWNLRSHEGKLPGAIDHMVSIYGSFKVIPYFKFFEVVIYLSAFLFVCFEKKFDERSLLLLTTFIGGVLLHILWEAKAQYALFYFLLLIPVAVKGCGSFRSTVNGFATERKAKKEKDKKSAFKVRMDLFICLVLFLLFLGVVYYLHIPATLTGGSLPYYQYIVENSL